jgi:hypothetical protein
MSPTNLTSGSLKTICAIFRSVSTLFVAYRYFLCWVIEFELRLLRALAQQLAKIQQFQF